MPFPVSDRAFYQINPIIEVICQIRFPTILEISQGTPADFQKLIRKEYPILREGPTGPKLPSNVPEEIAKLAASIPMGGRVSPEYQFLDAQETKTIALNQDFLAYSVNEYREWADFRKDFVATEAAFRGQYEPAFYSRVGLRYRNVLDREKLGLQGVAWRDLLNTELLGPLGTNDTGDEVLETEGILLLRLEGINEGYIRIRHGLPSPQNQTNDRYLIDADLHTLERTGVEDATAALDIFNKSAGDFFRWSITERLRDALGVVDG